MINFDAVTKKKNKKNKTVKEHNPDWPQIPNHP